MLATDRALSQHSKFQPINNKTRMKNSCLIRQIALAALLSASLAVPFRASAETDTFDTYTDFASFTNAGWVLSQIGPVATTFPEMATGRGLRLQALPLADRAPAVGICYRTTEYTDFYIGVDLVGWADTNQSIALLARGSIVDDPSGTSGYLLNYNVTALGDTPDSPRQGELQITVLAPDFTTEQLAIGEITFEPGRPYRIVFTGVGSHFTARVYDLFDLTKPLIQMEANDADQHYTNGVCGLMTFSRDDIVGTTDVTLDNYEIATYDPNPATAPALAHPVAGTPTIETRSPAGRFANFYDRTRGVSFTASTFTTDIINAMATKLRLNGVDVSSQLYLSPNGPNLSASLPGTALSANTVYSAQIEVQDITGQKRATNTFWFDTFSDAYVGSSAAKVIEAEDYNYSNGVYQLDPIPISGPNTNGDLIETTGSGYFNLHGIEGVDFHYAQPYPDLLWSNEFRALDPVGLCQGMYPEIQDGLDTFGDERYSDHVRNAYATNGMLEFVVHRTEPGEWLNYTRAFAAGSYNAYLRVASLGATEVMLDQVTSNPSVPGQTVLNLGRFSIPNQFTRYNYRYIPLVDGSGSPATLSLSGTNTLRLTMGGVPAQDSYKLAINYLLLIPIAGNIHLFSSESLAGPYIEELGASVDSANRRISVSSAGAAHFYRLRADTQLQIESISVSDGMVTILY